MNKPGRKTDEESKIKSLARAIVQGSDKNWRARAMRVARQVAQFPPSRMATGKLEAWDDWHTSLKRPDPEYSPYELFNLLRAKPNEFLLEILQQDRARARELEKMMYKAYLTVQLIEQVLEIRGQKK